MDAKRVIDAMHREDRSERRFLAGVWALGIVGIGAGVGVLIFGVASSLGAF